MTMIGRLVHYGVDIVLASTVIAGVRRSSGFTLDSSGIPEPTTKAVADKILGVGETIFDMIQGTAVNSSYFTKDSKR